LLSNIFVFDLLKIFLFGVFIEESAFAGELSLKLFVNSFDFLVPLICQLNVEGSHMLDSVEI
jgi:hypothetical protein